MLFLSGHICKGCRPLIEAGTIGLLCTTKVASPAGFPVWAADNQCFGSGYPGDDGYLAWLAKHAAHAGACLFATAPDVVGDAAATLERSAPMLPAIRSLGYRAALVAQDGLESLPVPWDEFDVLFIGGSTGWKLGPDAAALLREARRRGKGTHMGRVNFARRMRYVRALDAVDSIDGTRLGFGEEQNLPQLLEAIHERHHMQGILL